MSYHYKVKIDIKTGEKKIVTNLKGPILLLSSVLNKGVSFSHEEREKLDIIGRLPYFESDIQDQVARKYDQLHEFKDKLQQHIYLLSLFNRNQTLFLKLFNQYLDEIMPIMYTPIIAQSVTTFSKEFRFSRGLFISYPDKDKISEILDNRSHEEVDLIVITDGEGVLGLGDCGVGGMDIAVGKLMIYSVMVGIHPARTLPIFVDVGTNNNSLLNDPAYLGWRNLRLSGDEYYVFLDKIITNIKNKFPNVVLHWEDFGKINAHALLNKYRKQICSFNDDIQGTGVITASALLSGLKFNKEQLSFQNIVIFGAGTAGIGIAEQIRAIMLEQGISEEESYHKFWLVDRNGLITTAIQDTVYDFQKPYMKDSRAVSHWKIDNNKNISLEEVVKNLQPKVLIGCSAQPNAFTQKIISTIMSYTDYPIILPLSNPCEKAEITPIDLFTWTEGKVRMAFGSPFEAVFYKDKKYPVAQCNNALAFPGIGLGAMAVKAREISDKMLVVACKAIADFMSERYDNEEDYIPILPTVADAGKLNYKIACAVAKTAVEDNITTLDMQDVIIENLIKNMMWDFSYLPIEYQDEDKLD